jgi:hypothetical protein
MDRDLRVALRGLSAQGTRSLVQFIKEAIPKMSPAECNTLRRELDKHKRKNQTVHLLCIVEGRYVSGEKKVCDCTTEELLNDVVSRSRSAKRAVSEELERRKAMK